MIPHKHVSMFSTTIFKHWNLSFGILLIKVDKTPHVYRYLKCRHICALVSSDYAQQDVKQPSINQLQAQTYSVCFAISIG